MFRKCVDLSVSQNQSALPLAVDCIVHSCLVYIGPLPSERKYQVRDLPNPRSLMVFPTTFVFLFFPPHVVMTRVLLSPSKYRADIDDKLTSWS